MKLFEYCEHIGDWRVLIQTRDIANGAISSEKLENESVKGSKIGEKEISWRHLDENLRNVISTAGGGAGLSKNFGESDEVGITQKTLTQSRDDLQNQLNQCFEEFGDVDRKFGNIADEEDLTVITNAFEDKKIQFKNKAYATDAFSGLGKVYLRKNFVNVAEEGEEENIVNILTQDMFNKGAVGSRVPNTNTIFKIQYDYDLNGETVTVPSGCVLEFDGGSLSNGTLTGQNTKIEAGLTKIFGEDLSLSGSWNVPVIQVQWFGVVADGSTDDSDNFQRAVSFIKDNTLSIEGIQNDIVISKSINVNIGSSQIKKTIKGAGYYGLKCSANYNVSSGAMLNLSESEITLDGLYLKGISSNKTQTAISLNGRAQGITLSNINIIHFNIAIEYCNGACYDHILDCYIHYANYGFKMAGTGWRGALDIVNTKFTGCGYGVYLTDNFSSVVMRGGYLEGCEYKIYCDASSSTSSFAEFYNVYLGDQGKEAVTINNAKITISNPTSPIGGSYTGDYGVNDKITRKCTCNVISGHLQLRDCMVSNNVNGGSTGISNGVSIILGENAMLTTENVTFCQSRPHGLAICDVAGVKNLYGIESVPSYTLNGNLTPDCNPLIPIEDTGFYSGYTKKTIISRLETSNFRGGNPIRVQKSTASYFGCAIPYKVPKPGRYSIRYRMKKSAGFKVCVGIKDTASGPTDKFPAYFLSELAWYGYILCENTFAGEDCVLEGSAPMDITGVDGYVLINPAITSAPPADVYFDVEYIHLVAADDEGKICKFVDSYLHTGRGTFADAPILNGITTDYSYFATDLNKMISWNGTKWVDDKGFTADAPTKGTTADRPKGVGATGGVLDATNDIGFEYFDTDLNSPVYATAIANNGTVTWAASAADVPTALSQLSDDSTHRLVTDAEKATWNGMIASTSVRNVVVLTEQEYEALTTKDTNTEYNIIES